MTSVSTILQTR